LIRILHLLQQRAPNPSQNLNIDSKVQFNKKVTNIRYNTNDPASRSIVTCSDGSIYTARHVIFTGSLGVLKKYHETMFTPALPTRKVSSIRNIAFGNVAKFFMEFDTTFWQTPGTTFLKYSFMWTDFHKNQAIATNRAWMTNIAGIYAVDQFPNLLQVFFGGGNTDVFEMSSDETVINDILWMLDMFLPHLRPIPRPRAVHKTKWLTDDNFLGSYSYPSMNQERNLATIADLASTIRATNNMPMVLFAGEATSSEFPSMAHGALDSGYRAADEIISFHQ
jgi:monoamine oxidase